MKDAYSQGPSTFLKDTFMKKLEGTLASMSMAEYPVAIRQTLLYVKSTMENLGTVRAQALYYLLKLYIQIYPL